jgi:hypothetical protein
MKNFYFFTSISFVIFCTSLNAQWVHTNFPYDGNINCLTSGANGSGGKDLYAGTEGDGVFLSTNDGTSWQEINNGLQDSVRVNTLAIDSSSIFAGIGGIYRSINYGASWELVTVFPNEETARCIAVSDSEVFAGTYQWNGGPGAIYHSTNNGASWNLVFECSRTNIFVSSLIISDTNVFAGTDGVNSNVYRSSDHGTTWIVDDTTFYGGGGTNAFAVSGLNLFAGTNTGVYLSTNAGLSWSPVNNGLPDYVHNHGWITTLAISPNGAGGNNLFAGTDTAGVYLSANNGTNWTSIGLGQIYINALAVTDSNLFAATYGEVWRLPLSEFSTGIENKGNEILSNFVLEQNYPNPFNPSTKIRFQVPNSSFVNLKVYDVLGNEVATLVNEEKTTGSYEVNFNAKGLSSGIYFYQLKVGNLISTKKMVLMK